METTWQNPDDLTFTELTFTEEQKVLITKTKDMKTFVTWLREQFESCDCNTDTGLTGLPAHEFSLFIHSLKLDLTEEQIEQLLEVMDLNGDGLLQWSEAVDQLPLLISKLY